mgnify:FL=1
MRQFRTILGFELQNYFKNKVFVSVTIIIMLAVAGGMFYPRVASFFTHGNEAGQGDRPIMLVATDSSELPASTTEAVFRQSFPHYQIKITTDRVEQVKEQVKSGKAKYALVLSDTSYTYYVNGLAMADSNVATANSVVKDLYQLKILRRHGLSAEQTSQVMTVQIKPNVQNLGKDQTKNFYSAFIMIYALYVAVMTYGQMVATNVASEKSSRAMELLTTSASPVAMMFGKIIASCLAGLAQLVGIFGSAFLFYNLNRASWQGNQMINSIFNIPPDLLLYMILFFLLGFFIYGMMYGAVGSLVSKPEDIGSVAMPIILVFVIGFAVVMSSIEDPNNAIGMKICSFVPFTSSMAMFARIAMGSVSTGEIALSIAILVVSTVLVGILAAKIYRAGVLMYGTRPKLRTIWRSIRQA